MNHGLCLRQFTSDETVEEKESNFVNLCDYRIGFTLDPGEEGVFLPIFIGVIYHFEKFIFIHHILMTETKNISFYFKRFVYFYIKFYISYI